MIHIENNDYDDGGEINEKSNWIYDRCIRYVPYWTLECAWGMDHESDMKERHRSDLLPD